jgi:glycosyltransferase involved in cell wall biosynthesis
LVRAHGLSREIRVLPNGVDYPVDIPDKPWPNCAQHIIYAGSLFGWKGVDDLVAAMAYLEDHCVTIVGGSPEQIERLRARQPLGGGQLCFTGQLAQYEVQKLLATACIAVLPNRPDPDSQFTSPLKLYEYMASACAVVATDLPAVRDELGEADAAWAQAGNPESLAAAIRSLTQSPMEARALGQRGRLKVRTRTWRQRASDLLAALGRSAGTDAEPGQRPASERGAGGGSCVS